MSSVRANKQTGRDSFHVIAEFDGVGVEVKETAHGPKVALLMAMGFAERYRPGPDGQETITLEVWRRTVLGPETLLYRVERDEHGVVRGYTVGGEVD
jgi:hypothetical protein